MSEFDDAPVSRRERAFFYLSRRIRELEAQAQGSTHEQMAMAGVPYAQRLEASKAHESKARTLRLEIDALTYARDVVGKS